MLYMPALTSVADLHSRRGFFDLSAAALIGMTAAPVTAATLQTAIRRPDTPVNPAKSAFTSVKEFGAIGDGNADDTKAVNEAYQHLHSGGGTLFFPRGRYRLSLELVSRNVHITGEGRGASILQPLSPRGTVLRASYREGSWDAVSISDISIAGTGKNQGIGFAAGGDVYRRHDEYTGSTLFSRVQFANFDKCIARPFGSIGLWVDGCQFGAANYHFWAQGVAKAADRDLMHSGCVIVSRCHMDYFSKAMFYLDNSIGDCGQIVFENNIFESGPGFVAYLRNFSSSGGIPGMVFRNNWNENTATARDVIVEGRSHKAAKFLFAEDATSAIRFEDTPLGACELLASAVQTDNCSLQNLDSVISDEASTIVHERARLFTGTSVGRVKSIAHPPNTIGLRTPWFRMAVPKTKTSSFKRQTILHLAADRPVVLLGPSPSQSATRLNSDSTTLGPAQQLSVQTLVPMPLGSTAALRGTGWLVTSYIYRLLSGPAVELQINGTKGVSGIGELSSREWEMLVNISKFDFARDERITTYHRSGGKSSLLIESISLVAFPNLQDATDFVNAGLSLA
jgi:Pectate lyase superfamily protein